MDWESVASDGEISFEDGPIGGGIGGGAAGAASPPTGDGSRGARTGGTPAEALDVFLGAIRKLPVLSHERTVELTQAMREAEASFAAEMFRISSAADWVLEQWRTRRGEGRVTGLLGAGYRDGDGRDWTRHIDETLGELEDVVSPGSSPRGARASSARTARGAQTRAARIADLLARAELAPEIVQSAYVHLCRKRDEAGSRGTRSRLARTELSQLGRAARALEARDQAKQTIVAHNLKLVVKFAKRYRHLGIPFEDLIQEGNLGLIRAVEKFDHTRGFRFSTYAVWWIEQAMIRAVQNHSRTVRVPSHVYDFQLAYRSLERKLYGRLGREPTSADMAEGLGLPVDELERLAATMRPIASTQALVPGTDSLTFDEVLEDEDAPDPVGTIDRFEVRRHLKRMLRDLTPRERTVLEWRFGLQNGSPRTLEQIGRELGLSRERVRQIETKALGRLRQRREIEQLRASADLEEEVDTM